ncbi:alpha-L-fucosidase [Thermophagus sp. OGC60D27]|uniref:alpha-L-fucosidase n=1 Tax=Thermophagus sp. OGC60D27 TaxID=3458415 RepID=UPI0040383A10
MFQSKITITFILVLMITEVFSQASSEEKAKRMEWFKDAKLGIFVHYGIYAVNGIDESWSFFNGYITYDDYMNQLDGFTASQYDAERWVKLFKEAGAKYAVLTSKHHDGVALWKGDWDHLNVVDDTPAGRDLIKPFVDALRDNDMKVGLYYSLIDWSHPAYPAVTRNKTRYENDQERWMDFVNFYFKQVIELSKRYNPDLYWFDGDWEHSADEWHAQELRETLFRYNDGVIINSRLKGNGDYGTPEQGVPVGIPENPYWELCMTMNDSWGFQYNDHNYKTPYQLLWTFVDCISKGGNLLLDVGPMANGAIPGPQIKILEAFARWTDKHVEAIYGTRKGIGPGHFFGPTALSKDRKTLYLYINYKPDLPLTIKGLASKVKDVRIVGNNVKLKFEFNESSGQLSFVLPPEVTDPVITVVAVDFPEQVKLRSPKSSLTWSFVNYLGKDNRWVQKHLPLLGEWQEGISNLHYAGPSMLSEDKRILYLLINGKPNGPLVLKGLKNNINRIWVVGNGAKLSHQLIGKLYWSQVPGIVYIEVPDNVIDQKSTVVAVLLDAPISLYSEEGHAIESN